MQRKKTFNTHFRPQRDEMNLSDNIDQPNRENDGLVTMRIPFKPGAAVAAEQLKARGIRIKENDGLIRIWTPYRPDPTTELYLAIFCACAHKLGYSTRKLASDFPNEILKQTEVKNV